MGAYCCWVALLPLFESAIAPAMPCLLTFVPRQHDIRTGRYNAPAPKPERMFIEMPPALYSSIMECMF